MSRPAIAAPLQRGRPPRVRKRYVVLAIVVVVLAVPVYSYVSTMLQPSSLPLGVRSIEWLRLHHGAWIVNEVERVYYNAHAPKKGGPTLRTLPKVGAEPLPAARAYAPARIAPVITPALRGEGTWSRSGPLVRGHAPVLVTAYRAQADYPRVVAYVAWLDHTRTRLSLVPGRYEPPSSLPRGPMEVPQSLRTHLLATFNSGFTYHDGHGGFYADGRSYTPLQRGYATLVGYHDGNVDVETWTSGPAPGRDVLFARQNLPLLVDAGRPSAALQSGRDWGATLGNAVRVWRSGVGVDRKGNLVYAAADYQTAQSLAAILIHAGAVRAMELDINSEWPTFITYAKRGARDPVRLVPNTQQPLTRYLVPDDRDFFAVYSA